MSTETTEYKFTPEQACSYLLEDRRAQINHSSDIETITEVTRQAPYPQSVFMQLAETRNVELLAYWVANYRPPNTLKDLDIKLELSHSSHISIAREQIKLTAQQLGAVYLEADGMWVRAKIAAYNDFQEDLTAKATEGCLPARWYKEVERFLAVGRRWDETGHLFLQAMKWGTREGLVNDARYNDLRETYIKIQPQGALLIMR